jgi:acetyl-CoA/propionyl-CoA carboxylase biotin carboxyl carrier protein
MRRPPRRERAAGAGAASGGTDVLVSPIQGTVLKVPVSQGDEVEEGALICVVEAMKMENEITAHRAGTVVELSVTEGGSVAAGDTIGRIE